MNTPTFSISFPFLVDLLLFDGGDVLVADGYSLCSLLNYLSDFHVILVVRVFE
jgi:hypothetical protein